LGPPRLVFSNCLLALIVFLAGCATQTNAPETAAAEENEFNDPFEDVNRKIFDFNQVVDRHVLVPVAKAYRDALPDVVRDSIRDFLNNLRDPLIFANDTLQLDLKRASETAVRFVLNSTVGIGGLFDVAGKWGQLPFHEDDLGITFGAWGIPAGPYLVIPVLGPSDPRDLVGTVGESFGDPFNRLVTGNPYTLYWIPFVRGGVSGIDQRSRYIDTLADIERTSLDYYATIRSLYHQRREALIHHERQENLPPPASFSLNDRPAAAPGQSGTAMLSDPTTVSEVSR
ncbi:MAG: VacJ family lipoprotein, partial [Alphaproteobacteria bacterium]|nr:VacJ family lipoprotein [Alphaproteobacteria bacterium]